MSSSNHLPHLLDQTELERIYVAFTEAIREGLAHEGKEVRALPAFVAPPPAEPRGRALVLDTGGTNMRAALVSFAPGAEANIEGLVEQSLRDRIAVGLTKEAFFDAHAELAERLGAPPHLPVGFCFSYPFEAFADGDARLIKWTKGLAIEGVEGTLIGSGLGEALSRRGMEPSSVSVLNDTVAALLGGASRQGARASRGIGLIVGTGTNMAAFFSPAEAPKLGALGPGPMAVNLESGNFSPPGLSALDDALDQISDPRGGQRFEKAVSGLYLPKLMTLARSEAGEWAKREGARGLVERARRGDDADAELARVLLLRSAQLVATGLAAVASVHGGTDVVPVLAEGSLFWAWPEYRVEVERVLGCLVPEIPCEISRMEQANLVGAGCAALSRSLGPVERPPN